jgi:hypothetical protein
MIRHPRLTVAFGARTGAVTLIQCFGSALNLNIHLHMLFLDGDNRFGGNRPAGTHWRSLLEMPNRYLICPIHSNVQR